MLPTVLPTSLPRSRSRSIPTVLAAAACLLFGAGVFRSTFALPPESESSAGLRASGSLIIDTETRVDANDLDMFVTNLGSFANDIQGQQSGLIYPRGGQRRAVYGAGLWMGARVGGETRVVVAEYSNEYLPGKILSPTHWADPDLPTYRVYKITPGDTPESNVDYDEWPQNDDAPVDANDNPRHFGAQTLWSVYNDLDPNGHTNDAGRTNPLGIEVQQTTFALNSPGAGQTTVFIEWKILNKGSNLLQDAYVSVWSDPDLGVAGDDLVGCDPADDLGYCYNSTNADGIYGASPPAVGFKLLQGPIVPSPGDEAYVSGEILAGYRNLPMTSFSKYINGTDPDSPTSTYNYMRGLDREGNVVIDPTTGLPTNYAVSGDPVAGAGWIDTNPADRRLMLSAGPFTMAPGDVQVVVAAVIIGQGADRLASITELREHAAELPLLFRAAIEGQPGACCVPGESCAVTSAAECLGVFTPGATCDPDPCSIPSGACCFDNGVCLITTAANCAGQYQGDGSDCEPAGTCPVFGPTSACCLGNGSCVMVVESECLELGGAYMAETTCALVPPGGNAGWRRNGNGSLMIDEIAGPGGVAVPPDGVGGPGDAVWHSRNSTFEWLLSAGGGDGGEGRFTRDGADLPNLSDRDVILRFDDDPGNVGVWQFSGGEVGDLPFGLYERDAATGEETRLIAFLNGDSGTSGVFDYSPDVVDPFSGSPASDWIYAYRFDGSYDEFLADVADGWYDVDRTTVELFARLIFVDRVNSGELPAEGTEIQFSTQKSGIVTGAGFAQAVPLAWPAAGGTAGCFEPEYQVYRNAVFIGATERTDYLDRVGLVNGESYLYQIAVKNPAGEISALSSSVAAVPRRGGYRVRSAFTSALPTLDGVIGASEWAAAAVTDASGSPSEGVSILRLMHRFTDLYIALEDARSAGEFRIYIDANNDGVFQSDLLDGVVILDHGARRFERLEGIYPDVTVVEVIADPQWMDGAAIGTDAEVRLALTDGPLANRPAQGACGVFFWSSDGAGIYPPGPPEVLSMAPELFAALVVKGRRPGGIGLEPWSSATWALRVSARDETAAAGSASSDPVASWIVGELPKSAKSIADGRAESGDAAPAVLRFAFGADRADDADDTDDAETPTDLRAANEQGHVWRLSLSAENRQAMELRFEFLSDLPVGQGAWLVDPVRFELVDVTRDLVYKLGLGTNAEHELLLVVGAKPFLDAQLASWGGALFEVSSARSFPNPFKQSVSIAYRVRNTEDVSVSIYDVTGALVRRLSRDERRAPGVHVLDWNGRDDGDRALPSGTYFYRVVGESFQITKPVTILR